MRRVTWILILTIGIAAAGAPPPTWKVVLVAGDDSAAVFDNARLDFGRQLLLRGVPSSHMMDLSASDEEADTLAATAANLRYSLRKLAIGPEDACLLHLTSHGLQEGLLLAEQEPLTPQALDEILSEGCGEQPTVVLLSACYSGTFLTPSMQRPNRIILTAARKDRTSFGCGDDGQYNFWDECLLENMAQVADWQALYPKLAACIERQETASKTKRSLPQAFFGAAVRALSLPAIGWWTRVPPDVMFASLWDAGTACIRKVEPRPDYGADDVCDQ